MALAAHPIWLTKKYIANLEANPHVIGLDIDIPDLESILSIAADAYYNSDHELISDATYDILHGILVTRHPSSEILTKVGAPAVLEGKVPLPYWMGSANKIKPHSRDLTTWLSRYPPPYIISSKLDGISGLFIYKQAGAQCNLYTRGDGSNGQDVSRLLKYITGIPGEFPPNIKVLAIRGEIIMTKAAFADYAAKYPKARSMVAGIVNASVKATSKSFTGALAAKLNFVAYEIIKCDADKLPYAAQFTRLTDLGFTSAMHTIVKHGVDSDILSKMLLDYKERDVYEIDGIIIAQSGIYHARNTDGNPAYMAAYKMALGDQTRVTTVLDVEWNVSKRGILKPTVVFRPVTIGGDTISRATGFNARYIEQNRISIGTEIEIIKSGDVIPYITAILTTQPTPPLMPNMKGIDWTWNATHVDAMVTDSEENVDMNIKKIAYFMKAMGIKGISEGNIAKLVAADLCSLQQILIAPITALAEIDGFSLKSATNIHKAIHDVIDRPQELAVLMDASGCFDGFAYKKLHALALPNLNNTVPTPSAITALDGFDAKSADKIIRGMPEFHAWLKEHPLLKIKTPADDASAPTHTHTHTHADVDVDGIAGLNIVITGFRNEKLEKWIIQGGGKVSATISGKTSLVITKDAEISSSKLDKARTMAIPVITLPQFVKKYAPPPDIVSL